MKRIRGETTLDAMQRAYLVMFYRARADALAEDWEWQVNHAPAKMKLDALKQTLELFDRL